MDLAVLPDARVLHTERSGEVWLHTPATGLKTLAAKLNVYQHDEEGLQSIALDPNFATNRWVYLYYSPPLDTPVDDPATPTVNEGDAPFFGEDADFEPFKGHIQLSRFKWAGSTIDLASEQKILQVPVDRGICCHVGGDIVFDAAGNLILATGDDTNPFESDGYSPIDEREGRNPAFDAQRSSANTNDLRGKILRITVGASGGYTIPAGNLFVDQNELTRPEIYLMGLRNPFRIEFNQRTGELYVADYSPDAATRRTRCAARPATASGWRSRSRATSAGRTAPPRSCRTSTTTSPPAVRRGVRLRRAGQRVAAQHRGDAAAARDPAAGLVHVRAVRGVPRARHRRHRPDGRPRLPLRRQGGEQEGLDGLARLLRQRAALLRVDARLHQGVLRQRRPGSRTSPRRWTTTTRSTSSSARTGRCTCSSTATGSSARTCRAPSWPASTSSAPAATAPRA